MTRPHPRYEYKVVPAPTRGAKGKGVKGNDGKFANALEQVMNQMAAEGWEYQRAETLPSEERAGLTSKTTVFRNVLVFRRAASDDLEAFEPQLLAAAEPELDEEPEQELDREPEAKPDPIVEVTPEGELIEISEEADPDALDGARKEPPVETPAKPE